MSFNQQLNTRLTELLNKTLECSSGTPSCNPVVNIEVPRLNFSFSHAAGIARPDTGEEMTVKHPFHWASIGKTITAILILQLAEAGHLGKQALDTRLSDLSVFTADVINRLHRINGKSYGAEITIRQLLTHTSGIRDAIVDDGEVTAGEIEGLAPDSLLSKVFNSGGVINSMPNPMIAWDPKQPNNADAGVLNYFLNAAEISENALFVPGTAFHYSDTGYVILAIIIEALSKQKLHQAIQQRVFAPMGTIDAYLAYRNDPELGPFRQPETEIYADGEPLLSNGVDLSFDWGGGGIVSPVNVLTDLLTAIIDNRFFTKPETLDEMINWIEPKGIPTLGNRVGLGLFSTKYPSGELWGHSGAWGGKMYYEPEAGIYFAGSTNQVKGDYNWHWPFIELVKSSI